MASFSPTIMQVRRKHSAVKAGTQSITSHTHEKKQLRYDTHFHRWRTGETAISKQTANCQAFPLSETNAPRMNLPFNVTRILGTMVYRKRIEYSSVLQHVRTHTRTKVSISCLFFIFLYFIWNSRIVDRHGLGHLKQTCLVIPETSGEYVKTIVSTIPTISNQFTSVRRVK